MRFARRQPSFARKKPLVPDEQDTTLYPRRLKPIAGGFANGLIEKPIRESQSSRWVFSRLSWRSWASMESVAIGRASSRFRLIGSPVSSQ